MKKQYDAHAIPFTRVSAVDGKQLTIHKQTPVMKILCNYTYHDPILNLTILPLVLLSCRLYPNHYQYIRRALN